MFFLFFDWSDCAETENENDETKSLITRIVSINFCHSSKMPTMENWFLFSEKLEQKSHKMFSIDVGDGCWRQNAGDKFQMVMISFLQKAYIFILHCRWKQHLHVFTCILYEYIWTLEYNLYGTKDLIDLLRIDCHFVTLCVPYESYIVL